VSPAALVGPPIELPPIASPTMGIWSSNDFALLEEQMTNSSKYCGNTWRYERIDGPDHWMQWEAPDKVNELLLDFLPR
jgi:pimeloyl-ACP methyl ester carboxylesterase